MRLLHTTESRFGEFFDSDIPKYAILSHRWEDHEVSYQELLEVIKPSPIHTLLGTTPGTLDDPQFTKIQKCRDMAIKQNVQWVWIDTCCINKESSAELSEAINSMYRWYKNAAACFVYMSDVERTQLNAHGRKTDDFGNFLNSKWFTRGWTLQELLAPRRRVLFYDGNWDYFGDRESLAESIATRTHIDIDYISYKDRSRRMVDRKSVFEASVAERMSWVSRRRTSRIEDTAYCMLGLFDVNMPLLYGEGRRAFMRLQLEIIKKSDDESIFAWRRNMRGFLDWEIMQAAKFLKIDRMYMDQRSFEWSVDTILRDEGPEPQPGSSDAPIRQSFALHSGFLAQEPADFTHSGHCKPYSMNYKITRSLPYSITNQGLQFYVNTYQSSLDGLSRQGDLFDLELSCYQGSTEPVSSNDDEQYAVPIIITLRKEVAGHRQQLWRRHESRSFQGPPMRDTIPRDSMIGVPFYIRQDGL
jgi:Heterokaryon incompatibility protein (HET)